MTYQTLKNKIENAGFVLESREKRGETPVHEEYRVRIYKEDGDNLQYSGFHVFKDKNSEDNWYWQGGLPRELDTTEVTTFKDEVVSYVDSKIEDGTVEFAQIKSINDRVEKALVEAEMSDGTHKKGIIEKKSGSLEITIL